MDNATEQYKINLVELGFSWFRCYGLSHYTLYIVPILPSGKPVFPDEFYPSEPKKANYVPLARTI